MLAVGVVSAQTQSPAQSDADQVKARQRISMMEGVLERAVNNGADNLLRQVRTVMPDVPMLTGVPQARGFRLEGYGVFFDVEVPALRLPLTWTLRYMIDDNRIAANAALAEIRSYIQQQGPRERERLDQLMRRLEAQLGPPQQIAGSPPSVQSLQVAANTTTTQAQGQQIDPGLLNDPNDAYTREVKEALMDAMIENSGAIALGADEWLTVAARDNLPRDPLMPGDTAELNTIIFRLKGSDLSAFRSGRLTLEDARKRIDVREH